MRLRHFVTGFLLVAAPVAAQRSDVAGGPRFEVASVKQAVIPDDVAANLSRLGVCGRTAPERSGRRVRIVPASLCTLIRFSYNVVDHQVVGIPPTLAGGDKANLFEIDAQVAGGTEPTLDEIRLMMQALLAERFQLRIRREPRELPVYALVVAKGGPKWKPCSNPDAPSVFTPGRLDSCRPPRFTMARMAELLAREAGRPVIDRTGIADAAFELRYLPNGAPAEPDSPPSLFTALEEQLGLRLDPQRAPVDTIVVDQAVSPTPN